MNTKLASILALTASLAAAACAANPESQPIEERASATSSELVQIQGASCVTLLAGQTIQAGTVCSTIDGDNVVVTYATTGDWRLYETHLWAGTSLSTMPQTNSGNPKLGNFPYNSGALAGVASYSVSVPLSTFGLSSSMTSCAPVTALMVTHAVVKRPLANGTIESQTAYGEGARLVAKGNWATWFSLVLECKQDQPPVVGTCETAFAKSAANSTCFLNSTDLSTNRWGWTNGPIGPGSYAFDIFAAAGRCDTSKGTRVGTLNVAYDGGVARVSYALSSGFTLDETHLYVGSEPFARDVNGSFTVAPGQYGNIHDLDAAGSDSFTISGLSGNIYVVAHAVACSSNWPE